MAATIPPGAMAAPGAPGAPGVLAVGGVAGTGRLALVLQFILFDRLLPTAVWSWMAYLIVRDMHRLWLLGGAWLKFGCRATALTFAVLAVVLFLVRRPRVGAAAPALGRFVALAGTFLPLWIGSRVFVLASPAVLVTSAIVAWVGMIWSVLALAALGRCFGIFPEARGLVMRGPYRFVRHPLYLGEIVAVGGHLLPVLSPVTALTWAGWVLVQVWRAAAEEKALAAAMPEYREYMQRTWRLVPGIW